MKQVIIFVALLSLVLSQCNTKQKCSDCIADSTCVFCTGSFGSICQDNSATCNAFAYTSNITQGGTCPPACSDAANCGQCTSGIYASTLGCVWCNYSSVAFQQCSANTSCPAAVGNSIPAASCPATCQTAPAINT
jgi:hypothetical protein